MTMPLTPMEQGGVQAPTVLEGESFIQGMSESPYANVEVVSRTSNDEFDIYRVTVTSATEYVPTVFIVGGQHGTEPIGWEAALRWMRDAAFSTTPLWEELRQRARWVFMPMASPASIKRGIRATPTPLGAMDINTEHVKLRPKESQALQLTIRDYKPVMLVDCHEYGGDSNATDVMPGISKPPQSDQQLMSLIDELYEHVKTELNSQGIGVQQYPPGSSVRTLRTVSTLRHALGFLIETPRTNPDIPPVERAKMYMLTISALMDWVQVNLDRVATESHGARQRKIIEGAERNKPFNLLNTVLDPAPAGYFGFTEWPEALDILGIEKTENMILMGQSGQPLIPYLFDEASEFSVTTAHRYSPRIPAQAEYTQSGEPGTIRANIGGIIQEIDEVRIGTPNGTMTIWTKAQP